ncbi:MAG: hypothetical protein Q4E47_01800 [Candidatus Saccharibacteria bacterium]|nr:hypothetical protein [Candidatus Saccharibacteria bacterium]
MLRMGSFLDVEKIEKRVRAANYLTVAQLFLKDNFLMRRKLTSDDIKPRLLGHWGTCPGINLAYACLHEYYIKDKNFHFVLGPGHGFPALQANLFIDKDLFRVDHNAAHTELGIAYICRNFSWPNGFPSHSSPVTPGVLCEGGELGYALATAYGYSLGHPERTTAVLIGDGELETATALSSLNLNKILSGSKNGKVLPILHLNGYKISAPTISGRKSSHELAEMLRGFGFTPLWVEAKKSKDDMLEQPSDTKALITSFGTALEKADAAFEKNEHPFIILKSEKGASGPEEINGKKIAGSQNAHQIPLPNAKTDPTELEALENWLSSYNFSELFNTLQGFTL